MVVHPSWSYVRASSRGAEVSTNFTAHEFMVYRKGEGVWGVACAACSKDAQRFIYPCLHAPDSEIAKWPAETLYESQ